MKKWLMIGLVLVMAGITYAQIPQQEISRLITSLVDWRQQAVSPGVSFPTTCRTYFDTAGKWQVSCNGGAFTPIPSGSGAGGEIAVWSAANVLTGFTDFTWDDVNAIFVAGNGNTNTAAPADIIGTDNTTAGSFVYVLGHQNTTDTGDDFIVGSFNDLTGASTSGAFGIFNTIPCGDCWAFGEHNAFDALAGTSHATGFFNTVDDGSSNVWGTNNTSNGGGNNSILGVGNSGTHANNMLVGYGLSSTVNNALEMGVSSTPEVTMTTASVALGGTTKLTLGSVIFTALGTPANGSLLYCSDCDPTATLLACTHAGAQTGAFAHRVNGAWKCIG